MQKLSNKLLSDYLSNGGKLLATGESGLYENKEEFVFDFGVKYEGENQYNPDYFKPNFEIDSLKNSSYIFYSKGQKVSLEDGKELGIRQNPYFNRDVFTFCSHRHTPNSFEYGGTGMVKGKDGIYIAWNVFEGYALEGSITVKESVKYALDYLLGDKKTLSCNLPAQGVVTLMNQKDKNRIVNHLLYASPVKRGQGIEVIEDIVPILDTKVSIKIEKQLIKWKENKKRKPLLLNGIRQVGKTWILKEFGEKFFENLVYVNFEMEPSFKDIFIISKDPKKILFELSLIFEKKIDPATDFIVFDEIQECNEALNSLKYFNESEESYFIAGAGSYLGITLSKGASFPVGKVEMLNMYPMTLKEFLMALDQEMLAKYIEEIKINETLSKPAYEKLNDYLKKYYIVGGMPEAVNSFVENEDIEKVSKIQRSILDAYYRDFSKYPPSNMIPKIVGIWDSIVNQLSRENKKFKYSEIKKSARAREYEGALEWLIAGRYLTKIPCVKKLETPLRGYTDDNRFKIYFPDTGLLREVAGYTIKKGKNNQFMGAIAENFVLQELIACDIQDVYYWAENHYEIDFIISLKEKIIPIEVKAGRNVRSVSMKKLMEKHDFGVRFSMRNINRSGKILNIPLGMASETKRLICE